MEKSKPGTVLYSRLDLPVKVKNQPWYKERIDTKYNRICTDTSRWTFIKDGLDDYRDDGKPPILDDSIRIRRCKGMKPNLTSSRLFNEKHPSQRIGNPLDKFDVLYSKRIPNRRKRLERVKELENRVLNETMSSFSIRDDLSQCVLKDVTQILDLSGEISSSPMDHIDDEKEEKESVGSSTVSKDNSGIVVEEKERKKMYELYKKRSSLLEDKAAEDSPVNNNDQPPPVEMEKVEAVTKDFCGWVKSIGGTKNNIAEDIIKELFVCAYDGDPSTSAVQTMNLSKVPSELLADVELSRYTCIKRNIASRGPKPNEDKITYGAWYLPKNLWRVRPTNTLLQDDRKEHISPEPREKRDNIDRLLPSLHSAKTFLNFTQEKQYTRKPDLLRNVEIDEDDIDTEFEQSNRTPLPSISGD